MDNNFPWEVFLTVAFGSGFLGTLLKNRQVTRTTAVEELGVIIDRLREETQDLNRKYDLIEKKYQELKHEKDEIEARKIKVEIENQELRERVDCLEKKVKFLEEEVAKYQ